MHQLRRAAEDFQGFAGGKFTRVNVSDGMPVHVNAFQRNAVQFEMGKRRSIVDAKFAIPKQTPVRTIEKSEGFER